MSRADLARAIDSLLSFLAAHPPYPGIPASGWGQFEGLSLEVFRGAHALGLLDAVPKRDDAGRRINSPGLGPVDFLGQANLPGDKLDGEGRPVHAFTPADDRYFRYLPDAGWEGAMHALRTLATSEGGSPARPPADVAPEAGRADPSRQSAPMAAAASRGRRRAGAGPDGQLEEAANQLGPPHRVSDERTHELLGEIRDSLRAGRPDGDPPAADVLPTIYSLGSGCYRVGQGEAFTVTEREDQALLAFVGRPALDTAGVAEHSRLHPNIVSAVMTSLSNRPHLRGAIRLAGQKGQGGYAANVVAVRPAQG
jgi:hypothetical protein